MKKISRYLFGGLFILAGMNHFFNPESYLPLIPPYLPWPEFLNLISGALEVILGAGLLTYQYRRVGLHGFGF